MTPRTLLDEALEAWEYARTSLIAEADLFPDEGYDFRPHPRSRTLGELLVHVLESGCLMVGELSRPDGDFTRKPYETLLAEHAEGLVRDGTPSDLREELERTLREGVARLREVGEVHMLQTIRQFNGAPATRLAWMHHAIAHEEYHRGQVALYARMQDIVPALTRTIHGEQGEA
jgi:uncharacterized damage-inducible protein DinB